MKAPPRNGEAGGLAVLPKEGPSRATIHFPPFRLEALNERLWRGRELVALRPKTFAVLRFLVERPGQLIRKEELLEGLWGDVCVGEAVLKTYLGEIRQALGDSARSPRFIETAHRRGYRFIGRVLSEAETLPRNFSSFADESREGTPEESVRPTTVEIFVGRNLELSRLADAARTVLAGRRRCVLVSGEAGIGKTSLVHAFLAQLGAETEFAVAWGQCVDQYGAGEAYLPILEALRRLSRGPSRRALTGILRREAPTWVQHMPGIIDSAEAPGRGPGPSSERMLCELAEALDAFTRERPLVLCLEDLHWADHSTIASIAYLARRTDPARLLLIGTHRPAERASEALASLQTELAFRHGCEALELTFLSPGDLELYFARRFPEHRLPASLLEVVRTQTAGNPLFLERAVDSWIEHGLLSRPDGTWKLAVPLVRVVENTPASLASMIQRDLEMQGELSRAVLEAAATAGMEFSTASVAAALSEELVRVEDVCVRWARRGQFLRVTGYVAWPDGTLATRCEFTHALYRQVAYDGIGAARRAQLHSRIGTREEAAYGPRARDVAAELALHFERGHDFLRAVTYLAAAGAQALERCACKEAIAHFEHGLVLLERVPESPERRRRELDLLVALGAPLAMTLGHAAREVEQVYERARSLCRERLPTTQLFQALMGVGAFYLVRGEYSAARALSVEFLALAQGHSDPGVTLQARLLQGISQIFLGELRGAEQALEETIALYDPEQHRGHIFLFMQDPCVCALSLLVLPLWILGHPGRARAHAAKALELARELTHPSALVLAHLSLAQLEQLVGQSASARSHAELGLALAAEHGFELYEHTLSVQLGVSLVAQGDRDAGIARMKGGLEGLRKIGTDFAGTHWRSRLATALVQADRLDEASRVLDSAFARVDSHGETSWQPELYCVLGDLLVRAPSASPELESLLARLDDSAQNPEGCYLRALALARAGQARAFELRAAIGLAKISGAEEHARCALQAAYDAFEQGLDTEDLAAARALLTA